MKKLRGKEVILMSLPALALVGFGLYRPSSTPTLVLRGKQPTSIPLKERNRHNPLAPDTQLTVDIGCKKPPFPSRLWTTRSILPKPKSTYLVDAKGRKYVYLKDYGGSSYIGNNGLNISGDGTGLSYTYKFNLAQIPASSGKITFNTTYIADDGFELPVSIEVRS